MSSGFFFTDRSADDLIVRQKTATDSPLPSGNAAAAMALLAVGRANEAQRTISAFSPAMLEQGESMSSMVQAALLLVRSAGPFTVQPDNGAEPAERLASLDELAQSVVHVSTRWQGPRELVISLRIADGWHINAHEPDVTGLIGLTVAIDPADRLTGIGYPSAEPLQAEFATEPVRVHTGTAEVWVHFSDDVPAGRTIAVTVGYQACDDKSCLPAATKRVEVAKDAT